jgi:hypothetical protein
MKKNERTIKWLKIIMVCLLLGYAFIAGMAVNTTTAVAKIPEPEPESAFYTRWYESVFPPEVVVVIEPAPEPAFYTRWYESVFPPEVVVVIEPEPAPEPAFYVRWYESIFPPEVEEVVIPEPFEPKKPSSTIDPKETSPETDPVLS